MCLEIPLKHASGLAAKFGGFQDALGRAIDLRGGETVSSHAAPRKGLAHEEEPVECGTAFSLVGFLGAVWAYKQVCVCEQSPDRSLSSSHVTLALVFSISKAGLAGVGGFPCAR